MSKYFVVKPSGNVLRPMFYFGLIIYAAAIKGITITKDFLAGHPHYSFRHIYRNFVLRKELHAL
jgi:hypothetical protein